MFSLQMCRCAHWHVLIDMFSLQMCRCAQRPGLILMVHLMVPSLWYYPYDTPYGTILTVHLMVHLIIHLSHGAFVWGSSILLILCWRRIPYEWSSRARLEAFLTEFEYKMHKPYGLYHTVLLHQPRYIHNEQIVLTIWIWSSLLVQCDVYTCSPGHIHLTNPYKWRSD